MAANTGRHVIGTGGMSVNVAFTHYPEDAVYVARCLDIPGCISQGATIEEAKSNIADAIETCLSVFLEDALAAGRNQTPPA